MTKEQIINQCKQKNVRFIHLQFCDLLGTVKNITIPVSKLKDAINHNVWFDGSSIEGFARIYESDMYLKLDLNTFALVPWESNGHSSVARFICDVYLPNNTPFAGDPRQILRSQVKRAKKMGFDYLVGPELEFFLFPLNESGQPIVKPHDSAGYFDYSSDKAGAIRQAMSDTVSKMGVDVETIHHEVAPGQHEIDFKHHDAVTQADQVLTVKTALRAVAQKYNLHATFMPKPIAGINGNGMHVHQSLKRRDKNAFYSPNKKTNYLSSTARQFIAGQLKHIIEITALTNPIINSYKRLVPGYEAPIYVTWGQTNRSALIRIPKASIDKTDSIRCELRNPDSSSNPYLAFAATLATGLEGIQKKLSPPEPIEENIYEFTDKKARRMRIKTIPSSLEEAVKKMERGTIARDIMGPEAFAKFIAAKRSEINSYNPQITPWEIKKYLANY